MECSQSTGSYNSGPYLIFVLEYAFVQISFFKSVLYSCCCYWSCNQNVKNSTHFTDPESLFLYSAGTFTGSCPEPIYLPYVRSILTVVSHLCHGLPNFWFYSHFLSNTIYVFLISPICVACPAVLVLDFFSLIISGVQWKLWCLLLATISIFQWNMNLSEHWNKCI